MEKAQKRKHEPVSAGLLSPRHVYGFIALVVVFFLAFFPNIGNAIEWASPVRGATDDWHESLVWMRGETPAPFEDPDHYFQLPERPRKGDWGLYKYPESAYGVMSWWDYGYWITYIAQRIPNASPSGSRGARTAGLFFTAQDESTAGKILDELGTEYVIIDFDMAMGKYYAMTEWAGEDERDFFDWYFQRTADGQLQPVKLYLPDYYQSICSRLYNFGTEAVLPRDSTWVISYAEKGIDEAGLYAQLGWGGASQVQFFRDYFDRIFRKTGDKTYKEITGVANNGQPFATYEDAQAFLEVSGSSNFTIAGTDPFVSPVPIEAVEHYRLIHKSPKAAVTLGQETVSHVEIFEYLP